MRRRLLVVAKRTLVLPAVQLRPGRLLLSASRPRSPALAPPAFPLPPAAVALPALLALPLLLCSLLPAALLANGAEIGRDAGMVFPLESTIVHLAAETVDVRYDWMGREGTAECVYHLGNGSDSTRSFDMAFVTNSFQGPPGYTARFYAALDMKVDIAGAPVAVRSEPVRVLDWTGMITPPPDSLPVWNVTIPARDTVRVHMTYRVWPSGGSDGSSGGMALSYRTRPAALWAGPVGRAAVRFRMRGLDRYAMRSLSSEHASICVEVRPEGWRPDRGEFGGGSTDPRWAADLNRSADPGRFASAGGSVEAGTPEPEQVFVWEFRDWEPKEDCTVGVEWRGHPGR